MSRFPSTSASHFWHVRRLLAIAVAVLSGLAGATGADWPQWQGPDRNSMSQETGLLPEWPVDGPPLAWKVEKLGGGDSAPAIVAGRIYGMSIRDGKEIAWALSEEDGQQLWAKEIGAAVRQMMPQSKEGPGCTPTVDGDKLYVIGMGGDVACLQTADGKLVWQRSLTRDFGGSVPMWSYRESPLVDGDKLVCTPGSKDANLIALNKLTGETIWKSAAPAAPEAPDRGGFGGGFGRGPRRGRGGSGNAAYSSAIAIDFAGERQYVQLTSKTLLGVAADDGKVLWTYNAPANANGISCSTPIYHEGHVLAASAYGAGGGLAKLNKADGGEIEAEEVWFTNKMQNHHGGMVIHDGCVYGANGGNGGGFLICLDLKNGEVHWDSRAAGRKAPKGAIALADGRIYYRTEDGTMLLIEPSSKEYIERGRFEQPDRRNPPAWAHPVIANGKLYLRDQDLLLCYDIQAKK